MTNVSSSPMTAPDALRDIKPPLNIPNVWLWIVLAAVAAAMIMIAVGLILFFTLRRKNVPLPPMIPAHVRARHHLEDALALLSQPKPFCILVSDTIRFYLEERFDFRAPERTTEEFLYELQNTDLLLPDQKESLGGFLKRCDLVKFARYEPRETELRDLHDAALRLVDETEPQPEPVQVEGDAAANPTLETAAK